MFKTWLFTPTLTTAGKLQNIFVAFILLFIYIGFASKYLVPIYFPTGEFEGQEGSLTSMLWKEIARACILAPLWEEVYFRWVPITLVKKFKAEHVMIPVIVGVSIFFGYGHGGPYNVFIQGVMGLVFSIVYIKNDFSIKSSMLLHGMWNLSCTLISFYTYTHGM